MDKLSFEPCCRDWKRNIEIINKSLRLSHLNGITNTTKKLKYCPWCGANLNDRRTYWQRGISPDKLNNIYE
jgi:hypothetical protein